MFLFDVQTQPGLLLALPIPVGGHAIDLNTYGKLCVLAAKSSSNMSLCSTVASACSPSTDD